MSKRKPQPRKRGKRSKPSSDAFYLTMLCLSFMGLATVFAQELTTPDARTGQRVVRQQTATAKAVADGTRPVRLWKAGPKEVALASLAPQCDVHDWACVAWAAEGASPTHAAKRGRK